MSGAVPGAAHGLREYRGGLHGPGGTVGGSDAGVSLGFAPGFDL